MVRFSANLSFMYKERFFLSRFGAAKRAGFGAVEFLHHHLDYTPAELGNELREHSLDVSVFNAFPGDWDAGDRGFAARPGYEVALRESVEQALPYADAFGAQRMHVMAGLASSQGALGDAAASCYVENIRWAARRVALGMRDDGPVPVRAAGGSGVGRRPGARRTWRSPRRR